MEIIDGLFGKKKTLLSAAAFTQAALDLIQRTFPEEQVQIVGDQEIKVILNPNTPKEVRYTLYTDNAYSSYLQQPQELTEILAQYTKILDEVRQQNKHGSLEIVIKTVVSVAWYQYIADQQKKTLTKENHIYFQPMTGDIGFAYIFDREQSSEYLSNHDVQTLQAQDSTFESVVAQNFDNHWLQRGINIDLLTIGDTESVLGISLDGSYEKNLILSERFWKQLEWFEVDPSWEDQQRALAIQKVIQTKGDWLFIIPARSHLLLAKTGDPDAIGLLRDLMKNYFGQTEYPVSQCIFRRTEQGGLEVVETVQLTP